MTTWALITGTGLALALPIAFRLATRRFDPFEPIVLFALAYGVMFVVRPASMVATDDMRFWGVDLHATLPRVLVLALTGAVAFVCAYELRPGLLLSRRAPAPPHLDTRRAATAATVLAAFSAVLLLVVLPVLNDGVETLRLLFAGRSGALTTLLRDESSYLWYGSALAAPAGVVLTGLALRERSVRLALLAVAALGIALARTVPVGSRIVLLPVLGGIFVLLYVVRDRRPHPAALAGLAALALLVSYGFLASRDAEDEVGTRTRLGQLVDRPQDLLYPLLHGADAEMAPALAGALTAIPERLSYRFGGATVGNLVTRPVPRELWPGKPRTPGQDVVATVWPDAYPWLNPAFSPLLHLYWDFGLAGVLGGMALFGVLARALYEWFRAHRGRLAAQLAFSVGVWFVVIGARNDPVDTIVMAAFLFVPILLVTGVAATREGRVRRTSAEAGR